MGFAVREGFSERYYFIYAIIKDHDTHFHFEEFGNYRNQYVVKGDRPNNKSVSDIFLALNHVVKIAEKIREDYSKTMKGDAEI
ncbi:hypothetical protein FACS1894176_10810 [Bacteroidia bacterium]|nr:hypothetical protein FACS1894176_10810 [Bacteroidia bacterium]